MVPDRHGLSRQLCAALLLTCCACQLTPLRSPAVSLTLQLEIFDEISLDGAIGRQLERQLRSAWTPADSGEELHCRLLRDERSRLRLYQPDLATGGLASAAPLAVRCRWRQNQSPDTRWHSLELHTAAIAPAVNAIAPAALAIEEQRLGESIGALTEEIIEALAQFRGHAGDSSTRSNGR